LQLSGFATTHDFAGREKIQWKTRSVRAWLYSPRKTSTLASVLKGHGFSRADAAPKMNRASAPAVCLQGVLSGLATIQARLNRKVNRAASSPRYYVERMKYQLVIQFQAASMMDFDRLVAFENALADELVGPDAVDGHDFGSSEFNIFILTDHPTATFDQAMRAIQSARLPHSARIAYRIITGGDYVILWPPGLVEFRIA